MEKRHIYLVASFIFICLVFLSVFFVNFKPGFTGFAVYGPSDTNPCGATMTESSTFSGDKTCTGLDGITIGTSSLTLNCNGYTFTGTDNQYGLIISDSINGVIIKNCKLSGWGLAGSKIYTDNIAGYLVYVQNTSFTGTGTNISVTTAGTILLQQYFYVNVTWSNGSAGGGVTLAAINSTGGTFTGTSDANGKLSLLVNTSLTTSGGTTPAYIYNITATSGSIGNSTIQTSAYEKSVNLTLQAPDTDSIYPQFSNYWSNNGTLTLSGIAQFNVTVTNTNGSVYLNINGTSIQATNITANVYNASFFLTNGTFFYNWSAYGNGSSKNINYSENKYYTVSLDIFSPVINLISPANSLSSTTSEYNFTFNITDTSTISNCSLIIDNSFWNYLSSPDKNFTIGMYNSSLSVTTHTWQVNCTDQYNNQGNSSSRTFSVTTQGTGGSSGGGGSTPIIVPVKCKDECPGGEEQVACEDSKTKKKRTCGDYNSDTCTEYSSWKTESCSEAETCKNGACIAQTPIEEEIPEKTNSDSGTNSGTNASLFNPSSYIPHGKIPTPVINTVVYTGTGVVVVYGISWIWLWLLTLIIPFLMLRLRHYCVALITDRIDLETEKEINIFAENLARKYEDKIFKSESKDEISRFAFQKSGFMEIKTGNGTIINAHFSKSGKAEKFKRALELLLDELKLGNLKSQILTTKESTSIIAALRSMARKRRMKKDWKK